MRKIFFSVFVIVLFCGFIAPSVYAADTLKAVSMLPADHPMNQYVKIWVERMNKIDPNAFQVKYLGGPEVIPPLEQAEAVKNGVVQISFTPTAYYSPMLREADVDTVSQYTPWEERSKESGLYDLVVERHKTINIRYLGRWLYSPYHLWLKKPFEKLDDFKGRRMRTQALHERYMKEMGIVPVTVSHGETYTALERGLVEGFGWPILGPRNYGWAEHAKYIIDPGYLNMNAIILMNLDSWNKLSQKDQNAIESMTEQMEHEMVTYFKKIIEDEKKVLKEKLKVQFINLPPGDAKKFVEIVEAMEWLKMKEKVSPELFKRLQGVAIKK